MIFRYNMEDRKRVASSDEGCLCCKKKEETITNVDFTFFQAPGPASGSNQPPQPFFAAQMPPYPPPHFAPLQPGVLGGAGHSPPPSGPAQHFHKDERTQRQYNKLKKKLEQKQQRGEQGLPSPPYSPRKGKDATSSTFNSNPC